MAILCMFRHPLIFNLLVVSWLGYAWVCGITGVLPFVSTYHHPPDMYFVYIIQV